MSTLSIKLNSSLKKNTSNINSLIKNSNHLLTTNLNSNQFISYDVNINPEPLGEGSFKKCFHLLYKNNIISEKYILCIYIPKTQNHINRKEEIIQEKLNVKCQKYVTKLYDYGSIVDSSKIKEIFNNSNNTFHYCLFEKGLYDLEVIIIIEDPHIEITIAEDLRTEEMMDQNFLIMIIFRERCLAETITTHRI